MKKFLNTLLMLSLVGLFAACGDSDKNDDNGGGGGGGGGNQDGTFTITASNVTEYSGNADQVTTVKAIVSDGTDGQTVLATATYTNKGFTIKLPATFPADKLRLLTEDFDNNKVTISNLSAKSGFVNIEGHSSATANSYIDNFEYQSEDELSWVQWVYLDRDVNITGTHTDEENWTYTYNVRGKKGWNLIYCTEGDRTETVSTTKPTGVTLRWQLGWDEN